MRRLVRIGPAADVVEEYLASHAVTAADQQIASASAAIEAVVARPAIHDVVSRQRESYSVGEDVVSRFAIEDVIAVAARERIVAVAAVHDIVAALCRNGVIPRPGEDHVSDKKTSDEIRSAGSHDRKHRRYRGVSPHRPILKADFLYRRGHGLRRTEVSVNGDGIR